MFSVTLSVNARFREYCPRILRGMLPYGVRTFLQQIPSTGTHRRSSAIGAQFNTIDREKKRLTDEIQQWNQSLVAIFLLIFADSLSPMREKELLLAWKKTLRLSDDGP